MSSSNEAAIRYTTELSALVDWFAKIRAGTDPQEVVGTFLRAVLMLCAARSARIVAARPGKPPVPGEAARIDHGIVAHAYRAGAGGEYVEPARSGITSDMHWIPLDASEIGGDLLLIDERDAAADLTPTTRALILLLAAQADLALKNIRLDARALAAEDARQAARRDLLASECALAEGQRLSRTGSWRWNAQTRRTRGSTEFFRIYELPEEHDLAYEAFVSRVHADDRSAFEQALSDAAVKCGVFKYEYRIVVSDGGIRYLSVEGHPGLDPQGKLEFTGVVIDVTERRLAAEALQAAQAELARSLRFAAMGELAASIVHEINQPLTAVVTNSETCLRWLARAAPDIEQARQAATRTTRDAERVAKVVTGLRALTWKTGLVKTAVDIDDAIREVALLLRSDIERNLIALKLVLAASRSALGDRVQLQQVLLNLMRNAIEAMAGNEGPRRLQVSTAMSGDEQVRITVHDNGVGFSADLKGRVFEAMYSTKKHGMGMGLSISRSIVEAHGGTLAVCSNSVQGTSFQFTVPCA
jgi:signal transduction histidine kinase